MANHKKAPPGTGLILLDGVFPKKTDGMASSL
jgi:hypothetical protein